MADGITIEGQDAQDVINPPPVVPPNMSLDPVDTGPATSGGGQIEIDEPLTSDDVAGASEARIRNVLALFGITDEALIADMVARGLTEDEAMIEAINSVDASTANAAVQEFFAKEGVGINDPAATVDALLNGTTTLDDLRDQRTEAGDALAGDDDSVGGAIGADDDTTLTILQSANQKWYFDQAAGKWYVSYGLESGRELVYEATPQQMDALFGAGFRPASYESVSFSNLLARTNVTFGGDIAEMEGEGVFEEEVDRVIALALDEGRLPEWAANDQAAFDILFIAQAENKSNDWIIEQLATTEGFAIRFQGIEAFTALGLDMVGAVTAYLEFETGIKQIVQADGGDALSVTPEIVGALAGKGYTLDTINTTYATFDRMSKNADALAAFNEVLAANGMDPLDENGQFAFLTGAASDEVYEIYEASALREAAVGAGIGDFFSADEALDAALLTAGAFDVNAATDAMQQAAKLALQFRHEVNLGDIDPDDLIDMSLGLAPRSGTAISEVNQKLERIIREAQSFLQPRAKPFTGFSDTGTPQDRSLGNLRPSG